ncbi:MAG: hypothetical protein R2818_15830 [Flavobacteriales bacterium]
MVQANGAGPVVAGVQPVLTSVMFAVIFGLMARMSLPGILPLLFYMAVRCGAMDLLPSIAPRKRLTWNATLMPRCIPGSGADGHHL